MIGLILYFYHVSYSKRLINFLSNLNFSANYEKVLSIKKNIVQTILQKKTEKNGTFVPSAINENQIIYFAIDNVDLKVHNPDGKGQLHGTGIAVYQGKAISEHLYTPFLH